MSSSHPCSSIAAALMILVLLLLGMCIESSSTSVQQKQKQKHRPKRNALAPVPPPPSSHNYNKHKPKQQHTLPPPRSSPSSSSCNGNDTMVVKNRLGAGNGIWVECFARLDWQYAAFLDSGEEGAICLPGHFGVRPCYCVGRTKHDELIIYSWFKDHKKCKGSCIVEVKDDGWYRFNSTRIWEQIPEPN